MKSYSMILLSPFQMAPSKVILASLALLVATSIAAFKNPALIRLFVMENGKVLLAVLSRTISKVRYNQVHRQLLRYLPDGENHQQLGKTEKPLAIGDPLFHRFFILFKLLSCPNGLAWQLQSYRSSFIRKTSNKLKTHPFKRRKL
jgi:hypothetical protein